MKRKKDGIEKKPSWFNQINKKVHFGSWTVQDHLWICLCISFVDTPFFIAFKFIGTQSVCVCADDQSGMTDPVFEQLSSFNKLKTNFVQTLHWLKFSQKANLPFVFLMPFCLFAFFKPSPVSDWHQSNTVISPFRWSFFGGGGHLNFNHWSLSFKQVRQSKSSPLEISRQHERLIKLIVKLIQTAWPNNARLGMR